MSQTFLEDIPEFLEIQRNSFLRILDKGLIEAFEKINPIEPTSQCKYGLLFYPKELVLIFPENTITDAFLQGKTYGCKIYVPAIIYEKDNSSSLSQIQERRFNFLKAIRFIHSSKTLASRFSDETLFGIQESGYSLPLSNLTNDKKAKNTVFKRELYSVLSWECFLTMLLSIESFSQKKFEENKASFVKTGNGIKGPIESAEKQNDPRSLETYKQRLKPTFYDLSQKNKNVFVLNFETTQKRLEKGSKNKKYLLERKKSILYSALPKTIRQKSQLSFFKKPIWLRGRSNTSLIQAALERLNGSSNSNVTHTKIGFREWLLPYSQSSFINLKIKNLPTKSSLNYTPKERFLGSSLNLKPLSRKEWVCIGVLPLMTPRGHFIINGSHRIIISQMARAPGLYYQTGDKMQATIVPSKGAWLRISVKEDNYGEIKFWVRITPQRKMPYKLFIETYKYLESSKTYGSKGGSKFLNLTLKRINSKIKQLDKHYTLGVISGQINRTLLNPSSYSLGSLGRKRLNERLTSTEKKGYLTSKDISLIKDHLFKLFLSKSSNSSQDDIDHLENRRVKTCGELLQTEIETGMARLKKAIGKQLDEYSNPDSSVFTTLKSQDPSKLKKKLGNYSKKLERKTNQESKKIHLEKLLLGENKQNANNLFWLKTLHGENWELYARNREQSLYFFQDIFSLKKDKAFFKASLLKSFSGSYKQNLNSFFLFREAQESSPFLSFKPLSLTSSMALEKHYKIISKPSQFGTTLAHASFCTVIPKKIFFAPEKNIVFKKKNTPKLILSPQKIIGTKAFAGALREFFGSNPLSQYMDQTNPLAEITHKRRLSSLGPGGVDRSSAGIAIRGIHPSHYGRICPIETPEGKNAGLVNSMTMWARVNNDGFLETPYFFVKGGSLMSHNNNLIPQWNFCPTKKESQEALKIVSLDLKMTQSAFLPSIDLPTRDGSERSFTREKRNLVHLCGISPMQNISVATSLIPFLEHDDATRALMGSNMQRQAVPLLKAKEPLIRTGLEGKVVGESGHALQASCSGIISTATRTYISIDSFAKETKKSFKEAKGFTTQGFAKKKQNQNGLVKQSKMTSQLKRNKESQFSLYSSINLEKEPQEKQKFISTNKKLPFLKAILLDSWQSKPNRVIPLLRPQKALLAPRAEFFDQGEERLLLQTNFLFYTLNPSFRSLFKNWLEVLWQYELLFHKVNEYGNNNAQKIASKIWSKNSETVFLQSLLCWRTFVFVLDLVLKENQEKQGYRTYKEKTEFLKNQKPRSLYFPYGLATNQEKNKFINFINKKTCGLPGLQNMTSSAMQKPLQFKNPLNSEKYSLLESILFSDCISEKKEGPQVLTEQDQLTQKKFFINALELKEESPKAFWREHSQIKRTRQVHDLQQYTRSNQGTVCVQRPAVTEGRWVQKGDLIGDCSASKNGVLALGQNIVVAYLPMEGFNFEDAIVVSDRLVQEELYTSIHVERVEFDMEALIKKHIPKKIKSKKQKSNYKTNGEDWITFQNPHLLEAEKQNLNSLGIINVGSWVGPGDVLVSKVYPVERKIPPSRHLLAAVFQEKSSKILDTDDTSLRVPKGIHGRVINVKIIGTGKTASFSLLKSCASLSLKKKKGQSDLFSIVGNSKPETAISRTVTNNQNLFRGKTTPENSFENEVKKSLSDFNNSFEKQGNSLLSSLALEPSSLDSLEKGPFQKERFSHNKELRNLFVSLEYRARETRINNSKIRQRNLANGAAQTYTDKTNGFFLLPAKEQAAIIGSKGLPPKSFKGLGVSSNPSLVLRILSNPGLNLKLNRKPSVLPNSFLLERAFKVLLGSGEEKLKEIELLKGSAEESQTLENLSQKKSIKEKKNFQNSILSKEYKITGVRIYIAERRKLQVGDKMSGRHGNKGIVSTILPREDMPYLPDGTPVDIVLNPLGIPSRMNVGQVFECLLGLAASVCGESISHTPFDEMYGPEASRSLVYLFLYVSRLRSHLDWIFQPTFPGKTVLFDGRTGTPFEQWVTVGRAYMLKLVHMVDEKIHARSIGPRSLVTQQPVKGRARGGGQRLGEMEIWAFEGFGAAYTLQEILTIKSDDIKGRENVETSIISATTVSSHIPETFRITLFELRCLCLNLELNQNF